MKLRRCAAFGFAEHVHFTADAGGQRHDVRFAQRIDRRVGDLRELLAEIVVNDARPAGEHGERGIVAHRTGGFTANLAQHADHLIQLFAAVAELFLVGFELRVVELAAADLIVRQIFERHQTFDVFSIHSLYGWRLFRSLSVSAECRMRPLRVSITISSPGPTRPFPPLRPAGNPRCRLRRRR